MELSFKLVLLGCLLAAANAYNQPNSTVVSKTYIVNLDLPPYERWKDIVTIYKSSGPLIVDYFTGQAYGLDLGVIVALNFAYELRKWGGGHPNITSPEAEYQPHVCTSIVAQDSKNQIFHGRNMDWNLPEDIRNISVQIEFQRGNKTQYIGATYVGYVGIFTGMNPGHFSVSINERSIGGSPILDALNAILEGAASVTHLLRSTLERAFSYGEATHLLSITQLSAPVYYIAAGIEPNEGVVLTRNRDITRNTWRLPNPIGQPWYLLQTNYDHWLPDPVHDARRTYGTAHMDKLGQTTGATMAGVMDVLSTWPVMNNFTCQTVMMQPVTGYMQTYIRYFF